MHDATTNSGTNQPPGPVPPDRHWITVAVLDPTVLMQARVNSGPPATTE
jgi:hypothetical protein